MMQFTPSFILILGILFRVTLDAYAIPLTPRQKGILTLPLERTPMRRDLHPLMLVQMRNAHAQKRLAYMAGRAVSSVNELDRRASHGSARIGHPVGVNNNGSNASSTLSEEVSTDSSPGFNSIDLEAVENDTLTPANTPTTNNSLGLQIVNNDESYVIIIQMGTPPRDFKMLVDSGSADLWVGGEGCKSVTGGDCGNHVFLGSESSTSFNDSQKPFAVTYGTGSVEGQIITDNVIVAGMQLDGHTFGVATEETEDFAANSVVFDGIMGLAKSTLSQQNTLTPIESLAKAGLIKEAIASYKISRLSDKKNDGEITIGGVDASKFDQNTLVTLGNVNSDGFWEVSMDGASIDGQDLGFKGRTAILDTGTTLLVIPQQDAEKIHKSIPGAQDIGNGTFTVPCTTNSSLALTFGKQAFPIQPQDITFLPVNTSNPTGDCVSGISAGEVNGENTWLVGDVFLKNAYFSTNVEKNTVQLAKLT